MESAMFSAVKPPRSQVVSRGDLQNAVDDELLHGPRGPTWKLFVVLFTWSMMRRARNMSEAKVNDTCRKGRTKW